MMSVDATHTPFYVWIDHVAIRALIRGAIDLPARERLLLIKGLGPSLVDDIGEAALERFLDEVRIKGQRYAESLGASRRGRCLWAMRPSGRAVRCRFRAVAASAT
jgi:hypothetical protein